MKKLTIGISALALALAGAAVAAEAPRLLGRDTMFARDKVLTRAEAKTRAEEAFAKLDANHDGKLDKADRSAREIAHFDKMDTNHDGNLSRDEFIAAHEAMRAGPDGQPDMTGHDMGGHDMPPPPAGAPMGMGPMEHGGMKHGGMGHRGMGPRMMPHGGGMPMLMEIERIADPAHTGTITKDAFVNASLKLFDEADSNHDGKLTPQERKAAMDKKRAEMRAQFGKARPNKAGPNMPPPPAGQ